MKEKKRNIIAVLLAIAVAGTIIAADFLFTKKQAKMETQTTIYKVIERDTDAIVTYRYKVTEPTEKK